MKKPELNAVLAGLRLLQANLNSLPEGICGIFNDGGMNPITLEQIDSLCESLNTEEPHILAVGNVNSGINFIGPFPNYETAMEAGEDVRDEDWHVIQLELPEEETE